MKEFPLGNFCIISMEQDIVEEKIKYDIGEILFFDRTEVHMGLKILWVYRK